ncbi:MAG: cation:proton antiporter [Scytolyngbya sp. HA4215-MV1]|jgi:Kef-type K+ transport system membrane component KefB/nucleotide-binding universal stress UspA family protein|nr:cation:proton antiporter [Scytolyngbya sp. HA4215-MV1]
MKTAILVLVEVLVVIGLSRLIGLGCRWIKQPMVIGEIIAGIILGPSLLGLIAPDFATALFPAEAVPFLEVLSEVGLIFFMFLIGLELNPKYLRGQLNVAILTSHVSILVPFSLGSLLALLLYPLVSSNAVSFTAFALFLGSAMSITAFPVLARIITENNLQGTRLGALALTCAAVDDVTAWCLLALAIAVTRTNNMLHALPTILTALLYIGFMVTLGRQFLQRLSKYYDRRRRLSQSLLAGIYMAVVASALITELIGIHLIFGAFLLGAVMPKNAGLTRELAQKTEDFVLTFLLPVFFAYSGLRTQVGLLNSWELWLLCGVVLLVAVVGKYCGTYVAARVCGIDNREAQALGWLMNTRGLTELIVLNIGLSLNVISPLMFTMLVIMALSTTVMTSPMLEWVYPKRQIQLDTLEPEATVEDTESAASVYRVLVPIANPKTQQGLIRLAGELALGNRIGADQLQSAAVYPLSLIQLEEDYAFESTPTEVDRLIARRQVEIDALVDTLQPAELRQWIHPIIQVSNDVSSTTVEIADLEKVDLILVGWHRPAFSKNRLGGRVGQILNLAKTDTAVFVDRQHNKLESLLVPYVDDIHSHLSLELAVRLLINHENCHLTILQITPENLTENDISNQLQPFLHPLPANLRDRIHIPVTQTNQALQAVVKASISADLTIVGVSREWGLERQTLGGYTDELSVQCHSSLLITRKYDGSNSHLPCFPSRHTHLHSSASSKSQLTLP